MSDYEPPQMTRREALKGGSAAAVAAGAYLMQEQIVQVATAQTSEPRISLGEDYVIDDDPDGNGDLVLEHTPSGAEFRYDSSQDVWRLGDFQPKFMNDQAYVDHPDYGGDVDAALADVDLANLGSGSYGTIDPSNDGKTIRGVGANSDITSITAGSRDNIVGFFFRRQSDDPINLGQNSRLISPYLIGGSVSLGGGSGLLGASLFGESITLTGGRNSVVGCTDLFNNTTVTFDSDNNVAVGNTGISFTDNGSGNVWSGHNA